MRYFLSKNNGEGNTIFGPELKAINDAGFNDFENKRIELINKHGVKDDKGKPIIKENGQVDIVNMDEFTKELEETKKGFVDLWKFLDEEIEINPHKININDIPDEIIEDQPTMDRLIKYVTESA